MKTRKITVNTKNGKYPIVIGSNLIKNLKKILIINSIKSSNYLFIVDSKIPKKIIKIIKKNFHQKTIFYKFT